MTISFYRLLDLVVPGWEYQSTRFVNRRLLSTCCIRFTHRSGQVPLCRLRLVDPTASGSLTEGSWSPLGNVSTQSIVIASALQPLDW
ncbi:unnamed protein product [Caenorhabditis brenneri]